MRCLGGEDAEDTVGKALFEIAREDLEKVKRMLQDLWSARKSKKLDRANRVGRDMRYEERGGGFPERR